MPSGGFIAIAPHLGSHTPKHTEIGVSYVALFSIVYLLKDFSLSELTKQTIQTN